MANGPDSVQESQSGEVRRGDAEKSSGGLVQSDVCLRLERKRRKGLVDARKSRGMDLV